MRDLDILYLTRNRLEFTRVTMEALLINTDWSQVKRFVWYDDGSVASTSDFADECRTRIPVELSYRVGQYGNPVTVMNNYMRSDPADMFVKVDNDTLLPPQWLTEGLRVMDRNPCLGLLGLEAFSKPVPGRAWRSFEPCRHIGGIGFMRRSAFSLGLPSPYGLRYGFTEWQEAMGVVLKGWLQPALPVVLLDRVPFEPWASLSKQYIANGWQREWPLYNEKDYPWPYVQKGCLEQYERSLISTPDPA